MIELEMSREFLTDYNLNDFAIIALSSLSIYCTHKVKQGRKEQEVDSKTDSTLIEQ